MSQETKALIIGMVLAICGLLVTLFLLANCEDDNCTPEEIECEETTLVICNADHRWESIVDCRTIEPGQWACCEVDAGDADCCEVE
jgi:hypothetical protein